MTKILKLYISYPTTDTASNTEKAPNAESIRKLKTQELQLQYLNEQYHLIHADQIIILNNVESLTINELIISAEIDASGAPAVLADPTELDLIGHNIPSLFEDTLAAELNNKLSTPLEVEVQINHSHEDDPLAFLYANPTSNNLNNSILPIKEKTSASDPFNLLNQHFQPPHAVTEQSHFAEKNILRMFKDLIPSSENNPAATTLLRSKNRE